MAKKKYPGKYKGEWIYNDSIGVGQNGFNIDKGDEVIINKREDEYLFGIATKNNLPVDFHETFFTNGYFVRAKDFKA